MLPIEGIFTKSVYISGFYASFCRMLRQKIWLDMSVTDLLFAISIVGACILAVIKTASYRKVCRFIRKNGSVIAQLTETGFVKKEIKIPVIELPVAHEPFIIGILKPKIILSNYSSYNTKYIIEHELQHYRNHDLVYKFLLEVLCTVYWWNPLIYIVKRQMGDLFELHNDFSITGKSSDKEKIEYTETLLHVAKHKKSSFTSVGLGISSNESFLGTRIHSIFNKEKFRLSPVVVLTFFVALSSFFLVIEPTDRKELMENDFYLDDIDFLMEDSVSHKYHIYVKGKCMGEIDYIPKDFAHLKIIKEK